MEINLPNILTVLRILLVPLIVICLQKLLFGHALVLFAIAGITDALDGILARALKQKTILGAYLDPIADKLLLVTSFVALAILNLLPVWLTVIVISRDVFILLGVILFAVSNTQLTVDPTIDSKLTTLTQLLTVLVTLAVQTFAISGIDTVVLYLHITTAAFTAISGFHYIYIGLNTMSKQEATAETADSE